jgi:cytochrome c biogenesis protein CcmG/thiol:disulfide interchange protein DsbE
VIFRQPSVPRWARIIPLAEPRSSRLIILLMAATLFVSSSHPSPAATSLVHKKAPNFVRRDLRNNILDLREYRGKTVLLNFWATWCASCKVEMPRFAAWQNTYGSRGLQIIGISMDDDPALVRKAYSELRLNYPVAMGDEKLGESYGGILGLPMTFIIDAHGEIQAQFQGETDLDKIEGQLRSLLPSR